MFERISLTKIRERIWLMDDAGEATGYVVLGDERALVIDTMNGREDVCAVVKSITSLPITVVNTHGHCDHIFGNIFFDKAYLHPADFQLAAEHMQFEEFKAECEKRRLSMPPFLPIRGGDIIDLGKLHAEIIDFPGHTPGEILILLQEERVLFTGDGVNRHLWMQLDESLSMPEFKKSMERVMDVCDKADVILHGHATATEDISLMKELLKGVNEIIDGKTENDSPYHWFGGEGVQHPFAPGSVICYKK